MTSSARSLRAEVWAWVATRERPLPWRGERDPYRILVSEVMLQQTQAARVAPIYERFLARFGDVTALAEAEAADVLRAWENLGYNRRALNLWRAARAIVAAGAFPRTVAELQELPGVGAYTARAIASFAFDADVAAVDANVRRVVVRLLGDGTDAQTAADALVPRGRAAAWNQAMIDLGAEVCTARNPRCEACPCHRSCEWRRSPQRSPARRPAQRFEDTSRFVRGRIVRALREGPASAPVLRGRTGVDRERLDDAVASLVRDGLAHRRGGTIALGPAAASRR